MPFNDPPDSIVQLLTNRQHLRPHLSVREVLEHATAELGCCPIAIDRATHWLNLDTTRAIGRLRRGELLQLARSVHRFWHAAAANADAGLADVDSPK
ncbi:MAG: hypothetical protein H7Z14_13320 [Anaerolineae bacterium]|nr:hypothetical protein [Phycisphaerae bacterium]